MNKPSTFAKRLRELLDYTGWTQTELAAKTGISKSSINHYLKGDWEGKQDAVYSIARVANVSEAWLMGYDTSRTREPNIIDLITTNDGRNAALALLQERKASPASSDAPISIDFARNNHEEDMLLLARHMAPIPEEDRLELKKQFKQSIDLYLKAKGLSPMED